VQTDNRAKALLCGNAGKQKSDIQLAYLVFHLCEWADVMLVIGFSILIESLIQRKPILYLKYLHENITQ
jgi:hypothetical protein